MKKFALILLLVIFPFGQLLRVNIAPDVTLHLNDVVVGIIGSIGVIGVIKKYPFWVGAMILSLVVNVFNYLPGQVVVSSLYLIRWIAYAGLYFTFKDYKFSKNILVLVAVSVALMGILQYLLLPDVTFLTAQNWDDHYFRLISTFLDPGFTGIILVLGLLVVSLRAKRSSLLISSIIYTAMIFTYSRASYLAYLVGFTVISFYKKSLKIFLVALLILVLTISLLPKTFGEGTKLGRENSIFARINNWKQTVLVWQRSPVFGIGFDAYRYATGVNLESHSGAGADSSILFVLATTGILGLFGYLFFLGSLWQKGGVLFKATLATVFVHSWFNNTLFYPWVMEFLWLLLILDS